MTALRPLAPLLAAALLPLAPIRADAVDVVLGATSEYAWTSNFFTSAEGEDDASSFTLGPTLSIDEDRGRLALDLDYAGAYQLYVDQDGADNWESFLTGRASYEFDSRTRIRLTERFRDVSNLRFSRADIALADTALDPNQNRYFRNDLELALIRELSRKFELELFGAHHWTDFRQDVDRNDSQAYEGGSELRYALATNHSVGIGASYLRQDFQDALARLGSTNDTVSGYLLWTWNVADNVVFTASGGPAWIRAEYDDTAQVLQNQFVGGRQDGDLFRASFFSCEIDPGVGDRIASNCDLQTNPIPAADLGPRESFALDAGPNAGTDSVVTGFGAATLAIDLALWDLQATFSRRQSTTSGGGLASSLDRAYLEAELSPPNLRWSTFVAGSWDRRESLTDATIVDFEVDLGAGGAAVREPGGAFTRVDRTGQRRENLTAIFGVRTAFTRNQSATFEFRYRRTEGRDLGLDQSGVDTYFAVVTLAYTLDPLRF